MGAIHPASIDLLAAKLRRSIRRANQVRQRMADPKRGPESKALLRKASALAMGVVRLLQKALIAALKKTT